MCTDRDHASSFKDMCYRSIIKVMAKPPCSRLDFRTEQRYKLGSNVTISERFGPAIMMIQEEHDMR